VRTIKDKSHYKYAIFGKNPSKQNEERKKIREQSKSLERDAKEGERRSSFRKESRDKRRNSFRRDTPKNKEAAAKEKRAEALRQSPLRDQIEEVEELVKASRKSPEKRRESSPYKKV